MSVALLAADSLGHSSPVVAGWITWLFALILLAMIAALAFEEKLHAKKSIIVGTFAGLCLILETVIAWGTGERIVPFGQVTLPNGHHINIPVYIPAIDWEVITIILGASLFVEVTSKSGIFTWLAIKVTKLSSGDPWWLLIYYGLLTVLFSAVLNNVTAMIIVGSLTGVSLRKLKRSDLLLGFLVTEGLLTNVGGLLTLISSVPNIIVGNAAGIGFVEFFLKASPFVVLGTAATLFMAKWRFGVRGLVSEEEKQAATELVTGFDENENIPSERFFRFSVLILISFIAALAGQAYLPWNLDKLGMGFVALFFAGLALLAYRHEVNRFYSSLDWDLLAFFAALFVVINMMEHALVLDLIGSGISRMLALQPSVASGLLLCSSAVASSVTDNIPLAAMLAKILGGMSTPSDSPFWWCVILGANLGGNLTPIGSASTVVAMTIIHREKIPFSFSQFVVMAAPFATMQIILAVAYVLIVL